MRIATLAALLVFTACATTSPAPAPKAEPAPVPKAEAAPAPKAGSAAAPATNGALTVEFSGVEATRTGGKVIETNYSQNPGDTEISKKTFENGVITYAGQVGMGKGSAWAGIGFNWTIQGEDKPLDATRFKSITFRLAATTRLLRLRVTGNDPEIQAAGCYPIYTQEVTEEMKEYTIPLEKFQAEGWCAGKARDIRATLPAVVGNEVASVNISRKPITISVGPTTYNP